MKLVVVVVLLAVASVQSLKIIESFDNAFQNEIASGLVPDFNMQVNIMVSRLAATMKRVRKYQKLVLNRLDSIPTVPRTISGEFDRIRKHLRNQITIDKVSQVYTEAYNDFHDTIRARVLMYNNERTDDTSEYCWTQAEIGMALADSYFSTSSALGNVVELLSASIDVIETRIDADLIKYEAIFSDKKYKWKGIAIEVSYFL